MSESEHRIGYDEARDRKKAAPEAEAEEAAEARRIREILRMAQSRATGGAEDTISALAQPGQGAAAELMGQTPLGGMGPDASAWAGNTPGATGAGFELGAGVSKDGQGGSTRVLGAAMDAGQRQQGPAGMSGLRMGGGLLNQVTAGGGQLDALGGNLMAGAEQSAGASRSGLFGNLGAAQMQGEDGSATNLLGGNFAAGQIERAQSSMSGLAMGGGAFQQQGADGSSMNVLGGNLMAGHVERAQSSMTGLEANLGAFQNRTTEGLSTNILGGSLMAGQRQTADTRTTGLELDASVLRHEGERGNINVADVSAFAGEQITPDGFKRGIEGSATALGMGGNLDLNETTNVGAGFKLGNAEVAASVTESTASLGAEVEALTTEISAERSDPTRKDDESVRGGLEFLGLGAAGRLHYGDKDNDGYREYGFGFDAKVGLGVTMDFKTEDPLRSALRAAPGGDLMGRGFDHLVPDANMTEWAGDKAVEGYEYGKEAVSQGAAWAGEKASQGYAWGSEKAGQGWDWTKEAAGTVADNVSDWGGRAADAAGNAWDAGREKMGNGMQSIRDWWNSD